MVPLVSILFLGFFLGMRHATDADHVVAVSTIVSRDRSLGGAARIGSLWGAGHTVTVLVVGGAIILSGVVVPPRVGLALELTVALMLILLGARSLSGVGRRRHEHGASAIERRGDSRVRPLLVGTVHGLAGSAAAALLVLGTIRERAWAVAYLLVFGAGTIAGMMLITTALAVPFAALGRGTGRADKFLGVASGLASVALGVFLVYRIGFVDGLFTGAPRWTPG
jgi:hypothetical protein